MSGAFFDQNGTAAGGFDGGIAVRDGHADINRVTVSRSAGQGLFVGLQGTADAYGSTFDRSRVAGIAIEERGMVAFSTPKSTIRNTTGPAVTCTGGGKAVLYGTQAQLFAFSANQSNLAAACTAP